MFSVFRSHKQRVGLWLLVSLAGSLGMAQPTLRVAADPNNLPFSNRKGEGLENRLAELVARELGMTVEYMWWPQRRGFFRETVGAGRADVVMGVPAGYERVLTTRPYYRSTFAFVQRAGNAIIDSVDDPALRTLRIGVQLAGDDGNNTPPSHALAARGIVDNVRGYTLFGDYGRESPPSAIITGVAAGEIDVAIAWGPMAGFFAHRQDVPLTVTAAEPCDCPSMPFAFSIAVGVAHGNERLRDRIDRILVGRRAEVKRILDDYHVPQLAVSSETEASHGRED